MAQPRALILRTAGTNCDRETAYAFGLAGAETDFLHVNELVHNPRALDAVQVLAVPGGFTYGDDIAAGKILANQLYHHLYDKLVDFVERDRLVIGICNGFQVLAKTGLLPGWGGGAADQRITLTHNDEGRFECRWVHLSSPGSRCVFFPEAGQIALPVAHAEGKFVTKAKDDLKKLIDSGQVVFRYCAPDGSEPDYPDNPNGSMDRIAGVCDSTGRVLGLMPHPERFVRREQHPNWTRGGLPKEGDGLALFRNAVNYFG